MADDAPPADPVAAMQQVVATVTARAVLHPAVPPLLKVAALLLGTAAHLKLGMQRKPLPSKEEAKTELEKGLMRVVRGERVK